MDYIKSVSPDQKHSATLIFENEIRFGPAYYKLHIDNQPLDNRIFGSELKWHDSANMFAAEEWLTVNYNEGPITRAVLFDLDQARWSAMSTVTKGFARNFRFESWAFIYQKHNPASGINNEIELAISEVSAWQRLTF